MDTEGIFTLHCIRNDGRRETTKLRDHRLSDAQVLARRVLQIGKGLYTEVDICAEDGYVEIIQPTSVADTVWMT